MRRGWHTWWQQQARVEDLKKLLLLNVLRPLLAGRPWSSRRAGRAARRVPADARGPRGGLHQRRAMAGAGFTSAARWLRRQRLSLGRSAAARSGAVDESKEAWSRVFFFFSGDGRGSRARAGAWVGGENRDFCPYGTGLRSNANFVGFVKMSL